MNGVATNGKTQQRREHDDMAQRDGAPQRVEPRHARAASTAAAPHGRGAAPRGGGRIAAAAPEFIAGATATRSSAPLRALMPAGP